MGIHVLLVYLFLAMGRCIAGINICPPGFVADDIRDLLGPFNYTQVGLWHQVPCLAYRPGEKIDRVIWWKGSSLEDTSRERLIGHFKGEDDPESNRYEFSYNFSLVIKGVLKSDEGRYLCEVVPYDTRKRTEKIDIQVIGDSFPSGESETSSTASFQRGRRQPLPCLCVPQTRDAPISVVYWSTGEGITTDTEIIGARFSDGTVLQIQHGADYSIGSDASLTINSLNDIQDTKIFWCHVFHADGTLSSCHTDVQISDDGQSTDGALKALETSFYLVKDTQQVLPCTTWTPGDTACEIQWLKLDKFDGRIVTSYNVSTDVDTNSSYHLGSDFSLVIRSVKDDDAGRYRCIADNGTREDLKVRVIGDQFELPTDDNRDIASNYVTFEPNSLGEFIITCPAGLNDSVMSRVTLVWSYGTPDAQTTNVIGLLNLPDKSKKMSHLGDNGCFNISTEGSLVMSNRAKCSQLEDGDVRYWCHVFPYGDFLKASYVDVVYETNDAVVPINAIIVVIIVVVIVGVLIIISMAAFCLWWRWSKRSCKKLEHQNFDSDDGNIRSDMIELEMPIVRPDLKSINSSLQELYTESQTRNELENLYTPPELFLNVRVADGTVRNTLTSEIEILDDGDSDLSSKQFLIAGRAGSGKTTLLYKLGCDWNTQNGNDQFQRSVKHIKAVNFCNAVANLSHICPNRLLLLVDDCNEEKDIVDIMEVIKDKHFEFRVVMTTRHAQLAEDMSRRYNLRHVTITGFTSEKTRSYIQKLPYLTVKTAGSENDLCNKQKEDLIKFFDQHIIFPNVICLPAFLTMIGSYLSALAKCRAFDCSNTMGGLVLMLLKNMFEKVDSRSSIGNNFKPDFENVDSPQHHFEVGSQTSIELENLSCDVQGTDNRTIRKAKKRSPVVQVVGSIERNTLEPDVDMLGDGAFRTLNKIDVGFKKNVVLKKPLIEFVDACGKFALMRLIESGEDNFPKSYFSNYCDNENILDLGINIGVLRCENESETKTVDEDESKTLLSRDCTVRFSLQIFEEFCAGVHMAQNVPEWLDRIGIELVTRKIEKMANVLVFASLGKPDSRMIIVKRLIEIINQKRARGGRDLNCELELQKLIELILELNCESRCEGGLNEQLSMLFSEGQLRLIGVSSHKIRLLAYCLKYAPKTQHRLSLKSIELFQIGKHEWAEIKEYLKYFFGFSTGALEDTDIVSDVSERNKLKPGTLKRLREGIESRDNHMPKFPSDQSDISVLQTVQSLGLQELTKSQSGECQSSSAATELVRYLTDQQQLESLVLNGTIIGSQEIRDLAHDLDRLTSLKKLDLRLNTEIDDRAFVKLISSLRNCKSLSDLRLSLFKVTKEGFDDVQNEMEKGARLLERVQMLYLLHGSLDESYDKFLADSLKYMVNVGCLHVSALPRLPDGIVSEFKQTIPKPEILKELVIDNKKVDTSDWLKRDLDSGASTSCDAAFGSDTVVCTVNKTTV